MIVVVIKAVQIVQVVQVALIAQVAHVMLVLPLAKLVLEFVMVAIVTIALAAIVAINVQIVKLAIHNVIQTTNNYLAPSHAYPLPAWQLPPGLAVKRLHDQLYTSLQE